MSKFRFPPRSTWFDRLSLYRYVGLLLLPTFAYSTYRALVEDYTFTWRVVLFWMANVLLHSALLRDAWIGWRTRREIHKSINEVVKDDDSVV